MIKMVCDSLAVNSMQIILAFRNVPGGSGYFYLFTSYTKARRCGVVCQFETRRGCGRNVQHVTKEKLC